MPANVDVSRVDQSGCISISRLIVGTPEKLVTPSRSINSSARPASHLYVSTMREPEIVAGCRMQLFAVTWNNGVGAMNTFWRGLPSASSAGAGAGLPALAAASPAAPVMNIRCIRLCTEPRWVSWAPLGKPVVPDV